MNIFLTGCTSYIGRYLAISFINQGDYVIGTSRKKSRIFLLKENLEFFLIIALIIKIPAPSCNKRLFVALGASLFSPISKKG